MKKLFLLLTLFILSFTNIKAQIFYPNTYYQQIYKIQNKRTDYNTYYEFDRYNNKLYFEIWYYAQWYSFKTTPNLTVTYYKWQYNPNCNCYQWFQYQGSGVFYYFQWVKYKQYFYYYNGVKYYN